MSGDLWLSGMRLTVRLGWGPRDTRRQRCGLLLNVAREAHGEGRLLMLSVISGKKNKTNRPYELRRVL